MYNYKWEPATGNDVLSILELTKSSYLNDIPKEVVPDGQAFNKHITIAIVNQFYNPLSELISVCKDDTGKLLAYTWAVTNEKFMWSDDKMLSVRMATVDLSLSPRLRIKLIEDMMSLWEDFCRLAEIPLIYTNSNRSDQTTFLKLHKRNLYNVVGSFAYKRLILGSP